ncbi:ABC transporter permease [Methylobacterium nonmethylotrophicum]|nr:ABC transporter permease [Methylobacterium nonmethylotrophicum]
MTTLLAWRNLRHDPVRFAATLIGIVFSVTLMTIQLCLLAGFGSTASGLVDHADADIWVTSRATINVDQSVVMPQRNFYKVLTVAGVAEAARMTVRFVEWRKPNGGSELVILVGSVIASRMGLPWNLVGLDPSRLNEPDAVAIDSLYARRLGVAEIGQEIEIRGRRARVIGFTDGVRTFTQSPYVFTSYNNALKFNDVRDGDTSYVLVRLAPGASRERVVADLKERVPDADVLTSAEFAERTRRFWIYATGAGLSLWLGAVLSALVGVAIVAQTLYAATLERLHEYATLVAMGAPARYLNLIVVKQALIAGVIGTALSFAISGLIVMVMHRGPVLLELTPGLVLGVSLFTLVMCMLASLLAVKKLVSIDPTSVFK